MTIEPSLVWDTFPEFTNWGNLGNGIAVDGSGNVVVIGTSHLTWGTPVRAFGGGVQDAYVAKFSPNGTLLWSTFLGGSGSDYGRSIAVDGSGNVLVTGTSDGTWGAPVLAYKYFTDAFVAKLNPNGKLLWNTFLGSSSSNSTFGPDTGNGIAVNSGGSVFVTGSSSGTWGNPGHAFSTDPNGFASTDAFVAKLSSSGALTWNTFLGASGNALLRTYSGNDAGNAIAVEDSGNVLVSGTSGSSWGAPVRAFTLGTATDGYAVWATFDIFVANLNSSGALTWNTFLGSSADEYGPGIAVNGSGNKVVVVGTSGASWGTPLRAYSNKSDAFAAQLNANGSLTWTTFLGASNFDNGTGVAVDGSDNVFMTGYSDTTWGAPLRAHTIYGSLNAFVAKLSPSGALQTNTFIGGINNDYGNGVAMDGSGKVLYITGWSENTFGTPLQGVGGNFIARVDLSLFPSVVSSVRASPNPSKAASVSFTVTFSRAVTGVDKADFRLTTGVTGASITSVSGSGATYTVVVNTGSGRGFLRLDVVDNDSIVDASANKLGGAGVGNGNFIDGQVYGIRVVQSYVPFLTKQ